MHLSAAPGLGLVALLVAFAPADAAAQAAKGDRRSAPRGSASATTRPGILPGTGLNVFSTIEGNVLNSSNGPMPNAQVRLRDARLGRIIGSATTDGSGLFAFNRLEPGSYVVELMAKTEVLAASQIVNIIAGQAASAVVKLPLRLPALGLFASGQTPGTAASSITSTAANVLKAAEGVVTLVTPGQPVSPQK